MALGHDFGALYVIRYMGDRHSTGVKILISALGLGVLGDLLFHGASFGLNAVVWTMSLIAFGTFLLWKTESAVSKKIAWLVPFTLLFGLGFAAQTLRY